MAADRDWIRQSFQNQPARTLAAACDRIVPLTGWRRGPSPVRQFLKDRGRKFHRVGAIPVPPQKNLAEPVATPAAFLETPLQPLRAAAPAGLGHVFLGDASPCVLGTVLCCLGSCPRIFVRAAAGRQRFHVLGAWNAVTRPLVAGTNTTVVNTATRCEWLRTIAT